jgi:hypothetical protein
MGKLASVYSSLTEPVDLTVANGFMFVTSGLLYTGGGAIAVAGCADAPADLVTCLPSLGAAGVAFTGATISAKAGIDTFESVTLPAIKEWGCPG